MDVSGDFVRERRRTESKPRSQLDASVDSDRSSISNLDELVYCHPRFIRERLQTGEPAESHLEFHRKHGLDRDDRLRHLLARGHGQEVAPPRDVAPDHPDRVEDLRVFESAVIRTSGTGPALQERINAASLNVGIPCGPS